MSHTEGKLTLFSKNGTTAILDNAGKELVGWMGFDMSERSKREHKANARRLVACWNYCLRMTTEDIEAGSDWIARAVQLVNDGRMVAAIVHCRAITGWDLKKAHDEIKVLVAKHKDKP